MKFLVTGASGFIGRGLVPYLTAQGHEVTTLAHRDVPGPIAADVDCVVNLAGLAHADPGRYSREDYMHANRDFAVDLARRAADSGVRRFIQVSTILVFAGSSSNRFSEDDELEPYGYYSESKAFAEQEILALSELDIAIVRPPLVYGVGVKGNFRKLMALSSLPIPLPFGMIKNRRSFIGLNNFINSIDFLSRSGAPYSKPRFHVTDGEPVSLNHLLSEIRMALGRKRWMLPVPKVLMETPLRFIRRSKMADQLFGDLVIDDNRIREMGWAPTKTMRDEIKEIAENIKVLSK
ncbi:MAG: NAD-dependent epimerase/dehydratase family protein [Flavobacteriaceae bacterium]